MMHLISCKQLRGCLGLGDKNPSSVNNKGSKNRRRYSLTQYLLQITNASVRISLADYDFHLRLYMRPLIKLHIYRTSLLFKISFIPDCGFVHYMTKSLCTPNHHNHMCLLNRFTPFSCYKNLYFSEKVFH